MLNIEKTTMQLNNVMTFLHVHSIIYMESISNEQT